MTRNRAYRPIPGLFRAGPDAMPGLGNWPVDLTGGDEASVDAGVDAGPPRLTGDAGGLPGWGAVAEGPQRPSLPTGAKPMLQIFGR